MHTVARPRALRAPSGPLGELAHRLLVRRDLERIFAYRREAVSRLLGRFLPAGTLSPRTATVHTRADATRRGVRGAGGRQCTWVGGRAMRHRGNGRSRRLAIGAALPLLLTALSAPAVGASASTAKVTVVAQGLNNPRGLAFGPEGQLFVAEAGTGGPSCVAGPRGRACFGTTASVSKISRGEVERIVTGLFSVASPNGQGATGPDGLSQRPDGALWTIMTASPQQVPPGLPPGIAQAAYDQAGQLVRIGSEGGFRTVAGVGDYDWAWSDRHRQLNPQYPDANPYGVLATAHRIYVVDAASNTLDLGAERGRPQRHGAGGVPEPARQ